MKTTSQRLSHGFTIIEILIVIVVLGILAAIVFTGYRGVKERAYNARVIEGARQYTDAIKSYRAIYRTYPKTQAEIDGQYIALTCLGKGYPGNTCGKVTGTQVYVDTAFYTEINKVLNGTGAAINDQSYNVGPEDFMGAVYGIDTVGGAGADPYKGPDGRGRTIQYALIGTDVDCGIQGAWSYNRSTSPPTTACEIGLEPYVP